MDFPDNHVHEKYRQRDEWIREAEGAAHDDREAIKPSDYVLFPDRICEYVFQKRTWGTLSRDARSLYVDVDF